MKTILVISVILATTVSVVLGVAINTPAITVALVDAKPLITTKLEEPKITGRQSYGMSASASSAGQEENWPESGSSSSSGNEYDGSSSGSSSSSSPNQQQSNSYGQQQSSGSGSSGNGYAQMNGGNNLAIAIVAQASNLNLSQLYLPANAPPFRLQYPGPVKVANPRQELLANFNFLQDFDSINPRNPNALWRWVGTGSNTGYLANNAAFVKRPANYKYKGHLDLISIPFSKYVNASDPAATLSYYEGAIELRNNASLTLNAMQRLLVRLVFSCETVNTDQFPLPSSISKNPWDDPREAACFLQLSSNDIAFQILVTNEGVWAYYYRSIVNSTAAANASQSFEVYRRIGNRNSVKDLVDGAIQYDARTNEVSYFLNGQRVYSISMVGKPPTADGVAVITGGNSTAQAEPLSLFQVAIGTQKALDSTDPNNPMSTQAIALIVNQPGYNPAGVTFADPLGLVGNETWGEGAIASLYQLKIIRADSLPMMMMSAANAAAAAAPAVYGLSSAQNSNAFPYDLNPSTSNSFDNNYNTAGQSSSSSSSSPSQGSSTSYEVEMMNSDEATYNSNNGNANSGNSNNANGGGSYGAATAPATNSSLSNSNNMRRLAQQIRRIRQKSSRNS